MLPDHYTVPLVPGDYNQIDKPRGMLFVTVVSAINVPKMDWFNGSDPYVRYACQPSFLGLGLDSSHDLGLALGQTWLIWV